VKLNIALNIADEQKAHAKGYHAKDQIVLHETVSENYPGLKDIRAVSSFLGTEDYGIHGITDADGNVAWALGQGQAIFSHTASRGNKGQGHTNTRAIGIEQVSRVMLDYRNRKDQIKAWLRMSKEINATAKLVACAARAHHIPLVTSDGTKPGITTHWLVTNAYGVPGGHQDCYPVNNGGYYPLSLVIHLAKQYYSLGYKF